ncbi:hypothetical protein DSO57_1009684 [Entomophthora muscae]|uniref:Uncharacterized protein n=1 Tax=Entomophthora muscae TaxID=34485 RepID=A0ACC2THD7_9FUNG|nr:hypothetical protein DSO57_1009684 [Entomophthora muscae]
MSSMKLLYFVSNFAFALAISNSTSVSIKVTDEFYYNSLNIAVYTRTWEPENVDRIADVVFVHGQAEHVNRYNHVFTEFARNGIKVHGFDQVGCGRTGVRAKNLGGAMGMQRVRIDIDDAITRTYDRSTPLFLMGHSFGGATILDYLTRGERRDTLYGAIASAPDLKVTQEMEPETVDFTALLGTVPLNPQAKVTVNIAYPYLSRNQTEGEIYRKDPMVFTKCSAVQALDLILGGQHVTSGGYKDIKVSRLLIAHGTGDKITYYPESMKLVRNLEAQGTPETLKFITYPDAYHELHNDIIKNEVISDYIKWIKSQV